MCENAAWLIIDWRLSKVKIAVKRFIEEDDRTQATLFPEQLDDYISPENVIRFVDAIVEQLDLKKEC